MNAGIRASLVCCLVLGLIGRAHAGLTRHDVLVIANSNSAASLAVADYYKLKRGIPASRVRTITCSTGDSMSPTEFASLRDQIKAHLLALGSDPARPETDPIKAIVLTYDIPHYITDYGEAYGAVDSALSAMFTESPWGKEPIGIYGYLQPTPGAPNAYYGDYCPAMSFDEFRANAAASTYYEAFPEPGFTIVRMLDQNTALAAGGMGILYRGLRSGDSWTWTPVRGKDKGSIGWKVSWISVRDPNYAYACTGNASRPHGGGSIIRTSNGGQTWTRLRFSTRGSGWKLRDALLGVDFVNPTHGFAVGTSRLAGQSATALMIRTTNGTSWTDISSKLPSGFFPRAVAAADANNVWICGAGGKIYRSFDAGETWTLANTGAPSTDYTAIWIRLDGGSYKGWAAGKGGVIARTEDGMNWTREAVGLTSADITDLAVYDQNHACAAYGGTSFLTFTRGIGWTTESVSLAPVDSAASAGSGFVAVGGTRYIFAKPSGSWACSYTGQDTPWRLRYLVTRLDGFSTDANPADGIPDAVKGMIDRAAAATSPGRFVLDEATVRGGYPVDPTFFTDVYNALVPIVGSSQITWDKTAAYLTGQSNVIGYTSHGMHDGHANSHTTWGRTFHNWANGGIAAVFESTDGRAFERPYYAWSLYAGGTKYPNKLTVYGMPSTAQYSGHRAVLCSSSGQELASAQFSSGQAQIDLSTVSWPPDRISRVEVRFPTNDPQFPGELVCDAWYPSLTGDTTIYDNRAEGVATTLSGARTLMAQTILEGASGGVANVDEPWSHFVGQPVYLFPRYAQGYTWGETAYMGFPGIGWQEVALGDPLMAPYATAPLVRITSPAQNGSLARGTVHVTATATPTNAPGIDRVEFRLNDDTLLASDTSAPYELQLNTAALADGVHTIEAIAYESGSVQNTGSVMRTIVVNNQHPSFSTLNDLFGEGDNTSCALERKIVTAAFSGFFYIEELNRTRGIRVVSGASVGDGDIVTVLGTLQTANGEREILADAVWVGQ